MANVSSSNGLEKRPKLRFPGFDEPWKEVQLGDIAEYRKAKVEVPKTNYVSTENMLQNFSGIIPYSEDEKTDGVQFQVGDTLLANIRPYLKKAWLASFDGACSTDVLAIHPKDVLNEFLNNIIAQDRFIEYVMSGVKGSKMPRGDKNHILAYQTAIPSNLEQKKVCTFLRLLSTRIEKTRLTVEHLKKYKRGAVRCLLSAKSCPLRNARWTTAKMGELGSFVKGAPLSKADISEDGTPFILYGELYTTYNEVVTSVKRRTQAQIDETFLSRVGDVVIPTSGETPEEISTASCVMLPDVILAGDLNIFRGDKVDGRIMSYLLNHVVNGKIARIAQGKSVVHIQASELCKLTLTYPDKNTQNTIIGFLSLLDDKIMNEENLLAFLSVLKEGLLQQLFI